MAKMGNLLYIKLLQIGYDQWMYRNGVLHERVEDDLLQRERIVEKNKMMIQVGMGKRGIPSEGKHLFNRSWGDIWDLPGNDKKIWLIEVPAAIKCGKRSIHREIIGWNSLES